jgi:hypothetical protein
MAILQTNATIGLRLMVQKKVALLCRSFTLNAVYTAVDAKL